MAPGEGIYMEKEKAFSDYEAGLTRRLQVSAACVVKEKGEVRGKIVLSLEFPPPLDTLAHIPRGNRRFRAFAENILSLGAICSACTLYNDDDGLSAIKRGVDMR